MLVLLDSNIILSALLSSAGNPAIIVDAWRTGRYSLLTCPQQIDEIRHASRHPRFRERFQPHLVGSMLNNLYRAVVWPEPIPRKHTAADPTDSYLPTSSMQRSPNTLSREISARGCCSAGNSAEPGS